MSGSSVTSAPAAPARKPRMAWPDVARGLCMVIVVLWHSSLWVTEEMNKGVQGPWFRLGLFLTPLRMPLFFFISGFFATRAVRRPLAATKARTVGMYYLYAVWTALFVSRLLLPQARGGHDLPGADQFLLALLLPTSFWYLWCLAFYFLLTHALLKLLGDRSVWLLLPLAVLSVLAPLVRQHTLGWVEAPLDAVKASSVLANYLWFFGGVVLVPLWTRLMERARWAWCVIGALAYVAIFWVALTMGALGEISWHMLPLSVLSLATAGQVLALAPMDGRVGRLLQRIGRDTLPIYIFHIFLLSVFGAGVTLSGVMPTLRAHQAVANWVLPPVMMLVFVPLALAIAALLRSTPLGVLLKAPARLVAAPEVVTPRRARN